MKKVIFIMSFVLSLGLVNGQESEKAIETGTVLTLGDPSSGLDYKYVHFPRKNFIIKRGAIANFKGLVGKKVEVNSMMKSDNGMTKIVLKRKDGLKFFRFYPKIEANLEKAMASGELKFI